MFEILIISIGLVLVIEGTMYYFLADRINNIVDILKSFNPKKIKTASLFSAIFGLCLIYFTFRFYGE